MGAPILKLIHLSSIASSLRYWGEKRDKAGEWITHILYCPLKRELYEVTPAPAMGLSLLPPLVLGSLVHAGVEETVKRLGESLFGWEVYSEVSLEGRVFGLGVRTRADIILLDGSNSYIYEVKYTRKLSGGFIPITYTLQLYILKKVIESGEFRVEVETGEIKKSDFLSLPIWRVEKVESEDLKRKLLSSRRHYRLFIVSPNKYIDIDIDTAYELGKQQVLEWLGAPREAPDIDTFLQKVLKERKKRKPLWEWECSICPYSRMCPYSKEKTAKLEKQESEQSS